MISFIYNAAEPQAEYVTTKQHNFHKLMVGGGMHCVDESFVFSIVT